jgi:hypothetical protein
MKSNPWHPMLVSAGILLIATQSSFGFSSFLTTWRGIYPSSTSSNVVGCATCHVGTNGGNPWNAYGWSVRQAYNGSAGFNITTAIRSVEGNDADGDGSANMIEITANTLPGWKKGNVNIYYFKNATTTLGNAPIATTTPFDPRKIVTWILGQGLTGNNALEDADPDKDGATNRQEYLFGGMANNSTSFPRPVVTPNGGANPSFTVDVRVDDPEFTITPVWSQNLTSFFSNGFTTRVDGVSSFGTSYARRRYETNLGALNKVFFRVEGVLATP